MAFLGTKGLLSQPNANWCLGRTDGRVLTICSARPARQLALDVDAAYLTAIALAAPGHPVHELILSYLADRCTNGVHDRKVRRLHHIFRKVPRLFLLKANSLLEPASSTQGSPTPLLLVSNLVSP